jgi:hypothetical protein
MTSLKIFIRKMKEKEMEELIINPKSSMLAFAMRKR